MTLDMTRELDVQRLRARAHRQIATELRLPPGYHRRHYAEMEQLRVERLLAQHRPGSLQ